MKVLLTIRLFCITLLLPVMASNQVFGAPFVFDSRQSAGLVPKTFTTPQRKEEEQRIGGLAMQGMLTASGPRLGGIFTQGWTLEIQAVGNEKAKVGDVKPSWAACRVVYDLTGGQARSLALTLSRLTPAALLETDALELAFRPNAGGQTRYVACPSRNTVTATAVAASGRTTLPMQDGEHPWLLTWIDPKPVKPGAIDTLVPPLLFVFGVDSRPVSMSLDPGGVAFHLTLPKKPATMAVLPLLGVASPAYHKVESWKNGLPADVARRCAEWASWLGRYPVDVKETASYDARTDTVTLEDAVTFRPIASASAPAFAPVLPAAMVGRKHTMPITIAGTPLDTGTATPWGAYQVVAGDRCRIDLKGLGKYVTEQRLTGQPTPDDAPLAKELDAQAAAILAAGPLAPYFVPSNTGSQFYTRWHTGPNGKRAAWSNPGETLYFLAEVLPLLPPTRQAAVKAYLREWQKRYPAETISHLPALAGTRRERFRVNPATYGKLPSSNFHLLYKIAPLENLYDLARYHAAVGTDPTAEEWEGYRHMLTPYLANLDWTACGFYRWERNAPRSSRAGDARRPDYLYGTGGVPDLNSLFNAAIGYLRLRNGQPDETIGWWMLARAAMARMAVDRLRDEYYDLGIWSVPVTDTREEWYNLRSVDTREEDFRTLCGADEFEREYLWWHQHFWWNVRLLPWYGLTPELARFLRDYCREDAKGFTDKVIARQPDWYLCMCEMKLGSEVNYLYPEDSLQIFLVQSWLLDAKPQALEAWLDIPWVKVGDLYYLQKLAETIRAYRGVQWQAQ